jgi:ribonuclease P protein component
MLSEINQKKNYISIKKNREFQTLFKKGSNHVTYAFVCYHFPNKKHVNRLGIVASKKVGNAVKRNRAKRIIREAFRIAEPELRAKLNGTSLPDENLIPQTSDGTRLPDKHYDFVFVARAKTPELKSTQIYGLMKKFMEKLK